MGRRKSEDQKIKGGGEPSSSMLTSSSQSEQQMGAVHRVLANPLLMDKIVNYAILKPNGKGIDERAIVNLRLVNPKWLQSTSRILTKSKFSVIHIVISGQFERATLNNKEVRNKKKGNILDRCASVFSKTSRSTDSILPIHLSLEKLYFIEENHANLSNFLEQCSDIIFKLSVSFPRDGGSMTLQWSPYQFNILQDIRFYFVGWFEPLNYKTKAPVLDSNASGLTLLQDILQNSTNLKTLSVEYFWEADINISSLGLPATFECLMLKSSLTTNEWILLTRNQLPNLKILQLDIIDSAEENLVSKILERFRHQLATLCVKGNEQRICIKFPLMEQFKDLTLTGQGFYFFPQLKHVWHTFVPNLARFTLEGITESMFLDSVQGLRFENVKNFGISIAEKFHSVTVSPNVPCVREMIASFPSIQKLTINFNLAETSGLKYLFRNFTCLKRLDLDIDYEDTDGSAGYEMVSLLLGISLELSAAMINKTVENVNVPSDNPESIMNLRELNCLHLSAQNRKFPLDPIDPFCFKVISKYGLEKMLKLQKNKLIDAYEVLAMAMDCGELYFK